MKKSLFAPVKAVKNKADRAKMMSDIADELNRQCDIVRNEFDEESDEEMREKMSKSIYEIQQLVNSFKVLANELREEAIEISNKYIELSTPE